MVHNNSIKQNVYNKTHDISCWWNDAPTMHSRTVKILEGCGRVALCVRTWAQRAEAKSKQLAGCRTGPSRWVDPQPLSFFCSWNGECADLGQRGEAPTASRCSGKESLLSRETTRWCFLAGYIVLYLPLHPPSPWWIQTALKRDSISKQVHMIIRYNQKRATEKPHPLMAMDFITVTPATKGPTEHAEKGFGITINNISSGRETISHLWNEKSWSWKNYWMGKELNRLIWYRSTPLKQESGSWAGEAAKGMAC